MGLIYRKIEDLHKYPDNPRTITQKEMEKLKASITNNPDYFEARPLILSDRTSELVIIAGNQRYDASIEIGLTQVPTFLIPNLTEEREKEIAIRDNVNNGQWDQELLKTWDMDSLINWGLDIDFDFAPFTNDENSKYTKKIEAPVYEPKCDICPSIDSPYRMHKYNDLVDEIDKLDISPEIKSFLKIAATRHIVFDYGEIAEYYAHASKEVQELMEHSALVIIDFDKAIENGFTRLKNDIYEVMLEDTDDEE
ncbi:MAG: ParB N-terminal domain-containing protein [Bacteroides sp.]|nr:ParB N-terminal domain-containing protein [Bacteroides sp.]